MGELGPLNLELKEKLNYTVGTNRGTDGKLGHHTAHSTDSRAAGIFSAHSRSTGHLGCSAGRAE